MESNGEERIYDDEIDLRDLFSVIWRRKWVLAGVVIASVFLAAGWALLTSSTRTEMLLQLNFSGIDKHEYPDQTSFEMHDLISQDLLVEAAQAIEHPERRALFLEKPRSFIFVDPFIPVEVREKMKAMEREKQTYIYLPNQFIIRFVESGSGVFSHDERKRVLLAMKAAFEEKFLKDHVHRNLVTVNLSPEMLEAYDYMEVIEVFKTTLANYATFLNDMIKSAGIYRSPQTGLSFVDILDSVENIRKIDLYEAESIIKVSLETKQKDALLKKYQYRLLTLEKEMQKKQQEAASARALLDEVWKQEKVGQPLEIGKSGQSVPQIVMDGSVLEKLSAKEYKAALLQRVLDAEVTANSLAVDKKFLEKDMSILQGRDRQGAVPGLPVEFVEASLEDIRKGIVSLGGKINELSAEYLTKRYSNISKARRDPVTDRQYRLSPVKAGVLSSVAGLFLGILIVFMVEFVVNIRAGRGDLRKEQQ